MPVRCDDEQATPQQRRCCSVVGHAPHHVGGQAVLDLSAVHEPRVAQRLRRRRAPVGVEAQQPPDEVLGLVAAACPARHVVQPIGDVLETPVGPDVIEDRRHVAAVVLGPAEGRLARQQLSGGDADGPHVRLGCVVHGAGQNLRGHVRRGAHEVAAAPHARRKSEVDHLETRAAPGTEAPCEHHVLGLDIAVDDAPGVAAVHRYEELMYQPGHSCLAESPPGVLEQPAAISTCYVLQDQNELLPCRVLSVLVQFDNGGVVQGREHLDLCLCELQDLRRHLVRPDDLADPLVARALLAHELDVAEAPPPELTDDLVVLGDKFA
mmetsp:Transcript_138705/g.431455  ORF Transcript_138705/g.431455 Transcript_138705/m.431455 type:complete len:322 (+) Transcript_138705:699-1664(+)